MLLRSMPLYVQLLKKKEQQTNALQAREGQVSRGAAQQLHVAARTSAVQKKKKPPHAAALTSAVGTASSLLKKKIGTSLQRRCVAAVCRGTYKRSGQRAGAL